MLLENWGGSNSMYIHSFNYKIKKKNCLVRKKVPPPPPILILKSLSFKWFSRNKKPGIISNKSRFFGKYQNDIASIEKFMQYPRSQSVYIPWLLLECLLEFKHNVCHHDESVSPPHDKSGQVQDGAHVTRQNQVNKSKHGLETLDIVIQQVRTGN